jgi:hypothetical protein
MRKLVYSSWQNKCRTTKEEIGEGTNAHEGGANLDGLLPVAEDNEVSLICTNCLPKKNIICCV